MNPASVSQIDLREIVKNQGPILREIEGKKDTLQGVSTLGLEFQQFMKE